MLTKRQALEFIYNISQHSRKVNLIMFSGILEVDYFEDTLGYDYKGYGEPYSLEDMVKQFIIENDGTQILQELDEIPIDVDMLEVGQTYKVVYVDDSIDGTEYEDTIVTKFISIEKGKVNDYLKFEGTAQCPMGFNITSDYIKEIYKVNECIN